MIRWTNGWRPEVVPRHSGAMDPVEISAGRLQLRPWQAGDEPVLLEVGSDPLAQRWTSLPVPYTAEHARGYVQQVAPDGWASGRDLTWAVCDSSSGQVLANVALRPAAPADVWDVGYWCRPSARGRGVVPTALAAACRWAFAELGVVRVEWSAQAGNWASRRAAEKAGFRVEGVLRGGLRHRGEVRDGWIGGLLPADPQTDTAAFPAYPDRSDGVVTLRRWRASDAADVARACADPEIARWLPVPVPYTQEVALAYVDGIVPTEWFDGAVANVAVTDATGGDLLGAIGLIRRGDRVGEVGYWVAPWARRRGVASRATVLHTGWGFEALDLARVELLTDVANTASQRVAERAGFTREGVSRSVRPVPRGTDRVDMVVWSLLPRDVPV